MSEEATLIVENPAPGVRLLVFNRPQALNAIDMAMFARFDAELDLAAQDTDVRAVVLAATGGRAFSAGFDIHEMAGFDADRMREAFMIRDPVMRRVASHRCPVIAAVDGICFGAGALVALACDMRVASPVFRFKVTAVGYGGANATWSLPPLIGPARAKEILMTGREVGAEEALQIGLVNRVVPSDQVAATALDIARAIAGNPPEGIEGIKRLVDDSVTSSADQGWRAEHQWMLRSMELGKQGAAVFGKFLADHDRGD